MEEKILSEFEKYVREKNSKISEVSIKMYKDEVRKYFKFANKLYKEKKVYTYRLTKNKFKLYKIELKKEGYSLETINWRIRLLSVYDGFLVETERKKARTVTKKRLYQKEKKNVNNISDETYDILIEMAKKDSSKYHLMFILYAKYKIPTRKLVKIKIKDDIDLKNKEIHVGNAAIKITKEIERALKKYIKDRKILLKGIKNEYLFVSHISRKDSKPMSRTSVRRAIKLYFERLVESDEYYGYWRDNY